MPPDLSEKNLEATIERVLTPAIPARGPLDREAGKARPGGSFTGVDGLLERFSHGWLNIAVNLCAPRYRTALMSLLPLERRFGGKNRAVSVS